MIQLTDETGRELCYLNEDTATEFAINLGFTQITIVKNNLIGIIENCYRIYGKSVVMSRALPNIYDGLKPVQKRILYVLYRENYRKKLMKSIAICADTLKHFHPHGEAAVYSSLAKLAQPFYTRVSVIPTQGN